MPGLWRSFVLALLAGGLLGACSLVAKPSPSSPLPVDPRTLARDRHLQQGLREYFLSQHTTVKSVEFDYLREGATVTGVAVPKYYVWVRLTTEAGLEQGACLVRQAKEDRFEVTDYLSETEIRKSPTLLNSVFPGPVVTRIHDRLKLGQPAAR